MAEIIVFFRRRQRLNWELILALAINFFFIAIFGLIGWEIFRP